METSEAAAPPVAKQIVKATLGDDTRRLTLELPSSASSPAEQLAAVTALVRRSFAIAESESLQLKYTDDEGDLCTLVEASVEDMVGLAQGGPWRLRVCQEATAKRRRAHWETDAASSSQPPEWYSADRRADRVFRRLRMYAWVAQTEWWRSMLNRAGVELRTLILPFCQEVVEQLDLVPEASPLRPQLEAFIDGSGGDHLGDVLAALLKAWLTAAESAHGEQVRLALAIHQQGFVDIVKKAMPQMPDWFAAKGKGKFAWKGKGKGKGESTGERKGKGKGKWGKCWSWLCSPEGPLAQLDGGVFGQQQGEPGGDEAAKRRRCEGNPWMSMVLGFLAQKGAGKGSGQRTSSLPAAGAEAPSPGAASSPGEEASPAAGAAEGGEASRPSEQPAEAGSSAPTELEEEDEAPDEDISQLMELLGYMGLDCDVDQAADLMKGFHLQSE